MLCLVNNISSEISILIVDQESHCLQLVQPNLLVRCHIPTMSYLPDIKVSLYHVLIFVVEWRFLKQELPTLPGTHEFTPVFSGVRVTRSLDLCVMFCILLFVFFLMFALAIELSVLSWFMASDYTFGIVILYLRCVSYD